MTKKKIFFFFLIFFIHLDLAICSEFKIVAKIDNQILTNVDIENEKKYLLVFNTKLQNISKREFDKLSINSLIRQMIKKEEVEKYFKLDAHSQLGDTLIVESLNKQGFSNKKEYSMFLKKKGLSLKIFKEKILIDRLWNTLIYDKFQKKIKIDKKKIKKQVANLIINREKIFEYNLSEILFDKNTEYKELKKFIEKYGFETAANKYSISDTASTGGKIGWIKINNLNNILKVQLSNLDRGQISNPIEIPNGKLLIKINEIRELKNQINIDDEIKKQINFEQNKQLQNFSINFYKKLKQNKSINEY